MFARVEFDLDSSLELVQKERRRNPKSCGAGMSRVVIDDDDDRNLDEDPTHLDYWLRRTDVAA